MSREIVTRDDVLGKPTPVSEPKMKTTLPDPSIAPASTGANLMKVVEDYGKVEEEELEKEITVLEAKLQRAEIKLHHIRELRRVAREFREANSKLETI